MTHTDEELMKAYKAGWFEDKDNSSQYEGDLLIAYQHGKDMFKWGDDYPKLDALSDAYILATIKNMIEYDKEQK